MDAITRKTPILHSTDKYIHWLIPKFTPIAKRGKLTSKQLGKMIIGDGMIEQENEVLTEMLYNKEVVLAWDFIKIGKVNREVASPQKIWTIEQKAWQVPGFQIPKGLTSTVIDILQEKLRWK